MRKPISIGVVGIGFGQQVHVPAFRLDSRCVIAGICASRFERAQEVAQKLGIPRACRSEQELMDDPEISVVTIATPPAVQAAVAVAAARAGKHVFCEKPLALNAGQAAEMLTAARAANVRHAVDFEFAELDAWQKAREVLQGGTLGKIRQVVLNWRVETYSYRARTNSWKTDAAGGGGTLNNFASHTFYYLEWLFGPVTKLSARLSPPPPAAEARADLWFEFAAGFPGSASIAADAFLGPGHRLEVYGEEGSLILDNPTADYLRGFTLRLATRKDGKFTEIAITQDNSDQDGRIAPVGRLASRFLDAIESGGTVTPNLEDGLRVQILIDAARLADQTGTGQIVSRTA